MIGATTKFIIEFAAVRGNGRNGGVGIPFGSDVVERKEERWLDAGSYCERKACARLGRASWAPHSRSSPVLESNATSDASAE